MIYVSRWTRREASLAKWGIRSRGAALRGLSRCLAKFESSGFLSSRQGVWKYSLLSMQDKDLENIKTDHYENRYLLRVLRELPWWDKQLLPNVEGWKVIQDIATCWSRNQSVESRCPPRTAAGCLSDDTSPSLPGSSWALQMSLG